MSESQSHIDLVKIAYKYIYDSVSEDARIMIQCDSSETGKTPLVGDFFPDVFLEYKDNLIIGEAKTLLDFERKHSQDQYRAYLQNCARFAGKSVLVISVPWELVSCAKNYFRRLKSEISPNTSVVVLNELGKVWTI